MSELINKISSYRENAFNDLKGHYKSLESSQSPHTLLITCSDSRLCPQEFAQAQAGELFVIRNAGNLIPPYDKENPSNEALTIEYGISVLNIPEIVVCGHASCGAMGGLMKVETLDAVPLVQKALNDYKKTHLSEVSEIDDLDQLIAWNVRTQLISLMSYPFISERVKSGKLALNGIVYDFVNAQSTYQCHMTAAAEVVDG